MAQIPSNCLNSPSTDSINPEYIVTVLFSEGLVILVVEFKVSRLSICVNLLCRLDLNGRPVLPECVVPATPLDRQAIPIGSLSLNERVVRAMTRAHRLSCARCAPHISTRPDGSTALPTDRALSSPSISR